MIHREKYYFPKIVYKLLPNTTMSECLKIRIGQTKKNEKHRKVIKFARQKITVEQSHTHADKGGDSRNITIINQNNNNNQYHHRNNNNSDADNNIIEISIDRRILND